MARSRVERSTNYLLHCRCNWTTNHCTTEAYRTTVGLYSTYHGWWLCITKHTAAASNAQHQPPRSSTPPPSTLCRHHRFVNTHGHCSHALPPSLLPPPPPFANPTPPLSRTPPRQTTTRMSHGTRKTEPNVSFFFFICFSFTNYYFLFIL